MTNTAFQQTNISSPEHLPFKPDVQAQLLEYIRRTEFKRLLQQFSARVRETQTRSIAVLSLFPSDGKSFLVSTLALGYAQFFRAKVLIVDSVQQTQNSAVYFQGVLQGSDSSSKKGKNAQVSNPSHGVVELLSTESLFPGDNYDTADFQIGAHITSLRDQYDLILLDTCSIAGADTRNLDPLILARNVDAALVLTSKRSLNSHSMGRLGQLVEEFQIPILGTVHNSWGSGA